MTREDFLSVLITFVFGVFAGAYLYLTGFAPSFKLPEVGTDDVYTEFVLTGESYGECSIEQNCLSFQLLENGAYRALYETKTGGPEVKEGFISGALKRELSAVLTADELAAAAKTGNNVGCRYVENGTNYAFEITQAGVKYKLDTCKTLINYEGKTWAALAKLFNSLATTER